MKRNSECWLLFPVPLLMSPGSVCAERQPDGPAVRRKRPCGCSGTVLSSRLQVRPSFPEDCICLGLCGWVWCHSAICCNLDELHKLAWFVFVLFNKMVITVMLPNPDGLSSQSSYNFWNYLFFQCFTVGFQKKQLHKMKRYQSTTEQSSVIKQTLC